MENNIMYTFKGLLIKSLANKLKKTVTITVFYKEDGDFIGVILNAVIDQGENVSKLYRIDDPWSVIAANTPVNYITAPMVADYRSLILSKFFKEGVSYEV